MKLQNNYFPIDEAIIDIIIREYEMQYIRYDNEAFIDLENIAYKYCSKVLIEFGEEFIEYLFKRVAKKHISNLFSFFQRKDKSYLIFFHYELRKISNRSELLDITEEALVYPNNLNILLNETYETLDIVTTVSKINLYKQILLSYVRSQWFDWYFKNFNINNIDKNALYKDYFIGIFIKDYLNRAFYLIQYIDDVSILKDIFHEDITPYLPNWDNKQQVNFFYERLNSFLLMKDIKDEQYEE